MKIAIVGSSGYIAQHLIREASSDYVLIGRNEKLALDLETPEQFDYDVLNEMDIVIFTAAVSGPDMCAQEYERCWDINVNGTSYFIRESLNRKCKVVFFSSDAVYEDDPHKIFDEFSETNPRTPYGKMKKSVEDTFKDNELFKAIRLSYVVSRDDKYISYCMSCVNKSEKIEVFHPFYRNCTVASDVIKTVQWIIDNWEMCGSTFINVCGVENVSRVQIIDELSCILGENIEYDIVAPDENFFENRPRITRVRSVINKQYEIYEQNSFYEKLKKEIKEYE